MAKGLTVEAAGAGVELDAGEEDEDEVTGGTEEGSAFEELLLSSWELLSSSSSLLEDGSSLELWEEDEGSDGSSRPWQPESGASKSMADSTRASAFCAMDRFIETSLKKQVSQLLWI